MESARARGREGGEATSAFRIVIDRSHAAPVACTHASRRQRRPPWPPCSVSTVLQGGLSSRMTVGRIIAIRLGLRRHARSISMADAQLLRNVQDQVGRLLEQLKDLEDVKEVGSCGRDAIWRARDSVSCC